MSEGQKKIDLNALAPHQLVEIKKQLDQEIEHLTESFTKLQQAQQKFLDCRESVQQVCKPENEGAELLVPLTSSLYVPGRQVEAEKVLVDVGTGYYVEKKQDAAIKFFQNKVDTLRKNLIDLEAVVNGKLSNVQAVEEVLKQKLSEAQAQQKAKS